MSSACWVPGADRADGDFPVQNLPWGVAERPDRTGDSHIVVAIGDLAFDANEAAGLGMMEGLQPAVIDALRRPTLNAFMGLGQRDWRATRARITELLTGTAHSLREHPHRDTVLRPRAALHMRMPVHIGDYTDFYASQYHATNIGTMFRPTNPLLPNWKHLPVGYHGRASSIVIDGTPIHRPSGQTSAADEGPPADGPVKLMDYELELGAFFGGAGNAMGHRIPMAKTAEHLFGCVVVNDWSARDIQKWEYQPLGPFNAKNFGTTISPWIVTMDALQPYQEPGPVRAAEDPPMLPYLKAADDWVLDIQLEVHISSAAMRQKGTAPTLISHGNAREMYWTLRQMLAHHTSTGCNMHPGDMFATGTISGPTKEGRGCLMERTWRGTEPITLGDGTERKFLQDGDEVTMTAWCERPGLPRIGFGACRGVVMPAF